MYRADSGQAPRLNGLHVCAGLNKNRAIRQHTEQQIFASEQRDRLSELTQILHSDLLCACKALQLSLGARECSTLAMGKTHVMFMAPLEQIRRSELYTCSSRAFHAGKPGVRL